MKQQGNGTVAENRAKKCILFFAPYYDPASSRMLSEDPIRDGLNWYTYTSNNPIRFIDPFGLYDTPVVPLREWYDSQLKYISEYYSNVSGSLTWNEKTKTASVSMSANGYSGEISYTAGINGSYIKDGRIYVKSDSLWNAFEEVIDPPLGYHPVRDTAIIAAGIVTIGKGPSIVKGIQEVGRVAGPFVAPIATKASELTAPITQKANDVWNKASNFVYESVPKTVRIGQLLNNPEDPFIKEPAPGVIEHYMSTIPSQGYGKIMVQDLGNGYYQILNGHHRVAALWRLGYEKVTIYLSK